MTPDAGQPTTEDAPPSGPEATGPGPVEEGTGADARPVTRQVSRKRKHDEDLCGEGGSFEALPPARPDQAAEGEESAAVTDHGDRWQSGA